MWRALGAAGIAALVFMSCAGPQVTEPELDSVVWTRLTPTYVQNARYPDVRVDSMIFTAWGSNPGQPGVVYDRLAFSGVDGTSPFVSGYLGAATWTDYRPRWVRSQMIVFQSNRAGNFEIYYRDLETFTDRRLFSSPLNESAPVPRPNAPGLIYVEYEQPARLGSSDLSGRIVLIPDTAAVPIERIYLTPDTMRCGEPDWHPSGQRIVFTSENATDLSRHVYTMNLVPGDSAMVPLTTGPANDFSPRWSPDGNRILFSSNRTGRWGLWVVHPQGEANGLKLVSFEDANAAVFTPIWTPDGASIIASSNGRGGIRSLWLLTNLPDFGF
ncbi:MAG TPA: hypothetical protein VLT84_01940 [Acidobacteriota bacterium]|nr:hypothetical protein [Acidobacteriota bacterium]